MLPGPGSTAESRKAAGGLVPPPPPDTPSLMSSPYGSMIMGGMMPIEMMNTDALKQRQTQLAKQLQNAKLDLKDREKSQGDMTERSKQFDELFQEGVISKRELENSKEELRRSAASIEEQKAKISDLQYSLQRIADKLKAVAKYSIAQKQVKTVAVTTTKTAPKNRAKKLKELHTATRTNSVSAKTADKTDANKVKAEGSKAEASKVDAVKVETTKVETAKVEAAKVNSTKVEPKKPAIKSADATRSDPISADAAKTVAQTKDSTKAANKSAETAKVAPIKDVKTAVAAKESADKKVVKQAPAGGSPSVAIPLHDIRKDVTKASAKTPSVAVTTPIVGQLKKPDKK